MRIQLLSIIYCFMIPTSALAIETCKEKGDTLSISSFHSSNKEHSLDKKELCVEGLDAISNAFNKVVVNRQYQKYWQEWALKTEDAPLFTQQILQSFIGLGIWLPEEAKAKQKEMSTEEWLFSHGLQVSVAIGDRHDDEARFRLDYRWSEAYQADVMFQVELPF